VYCNIREEDIEFEVLTAVTVMGLLGYKAV
jgi:hypothetical protein